MANERLTEATGYKRIKLPRDISEIESAPSGKTSFYVPTSTLLTRDNGFEESQELPGVLISSDWRQIIRVMGVMGRYANRYGEGGLEEDVSRQQTIFYTGVVVGDYILFYQRSQPEIIAGIPTGDPRLGGRFSIGFGGHKVEADRQIAERAYLLSSLIWGDKGNDLTNAALGVDLGLLKEASEELGIEPEMIRRISVLGAFHDPRIEDPSRKVQVGQVHTGIATILELDPQNTQYLKSKISEIQRVWWVKLSDAEKVFNKLMKNFANGKGPKVETWTEIMIRIFLPLYLRENRQSAESVYQTAS